MVHLEIGTRNGKPVATVTYSPAPRLKSVLAETINYHLILGLVSGVSFTNGNYVVSCVNPRLLRSILKLGIGLCMPS